MSTQFDVHPYFLSLERAPWSKVKHPLFTCLPSHERRAPPCDTFRYDHACLHTPTAPRTCVSASRVFSLRSPACSKLLTMHGEQPKLLFQTKGKGNQIITEALWCSVSYPLFTSFLKTHPLFSAASPSKHTQLFLLCPILILFFFFMIDSGWPHRALCIRTYGPTV